MTSLLPKEHGAYGQISFPLVAAFIVGGVSASGLLIAAATVVGFLAHEPALVLLGMRGSRAKRDLRDRATRWLVACLVIGAAAAVAGVLALDAAVRWALAVPAVPAVVLAVATIRGREKSWYGETAAAVAFSGVAVPVTMAAGAATSTALSVAIPFALLFVASTLAVRVVILRVRRGGDPRASALTRRAALSLALAGGAGVAVMSAMDVVAASAVAAAAPGLLTAAFIALRPPAPANLRPLGWMLVAVSLLTTAIIVTAA